MYKFLILFFIFIPVVAAPQNNVEITTYIENGKFIMNINPMGNEIAGFQTNIKYDARFISINSVEKGNFLSQNGNYTTFFSHGIITPTEVKNIFDAIIGNHSTSQQENAIIVNITGEGCLILDNVKLSTPDAQPIPFTIKSYCGLKFGSISGNVNSNI